MNWIVTYESNLRTLVNRNWSISPDEAGDVRGIAGGRPLFFSMSSPVAARIMCGPSRSTGLNTCA